MKILIVGEWSSQLHEEQLCSALKNLGCYVGAFKWYNYYDSSSLVKKYWNKIERRYQFGISISNINKDLLSLLSAETFDVIFFYRPTHIKLETITFIKKNYLNTVLIGYNNDNPFSEQNEKYLFRRFLKIAPFFHIMLSFRPSDIKKYQNIGCEKVYLFPPWFDSKIFNNHNSLSYKENKRYTYDVVFIGHYENDSRLEYLEAAHMLGFKVGIFGPYDMRNSGWKKPLSKSILKKHIQKTKYLTLHEYAKVLSESRIALCFLSKRNKDVYTTRCFEIPATQTFLFSEYSKELGEYFDEGVEADFFRNKEEFIQKLNYYKNNLSLVETIAGKGFQKVTNTGFDSISRANDLLKIIENYYHIK